MSALHRSRLTLVLEIHRRLKRLAEARQQSPHLLMNEAISQYLEREEKSEALRQATADL